MSTHAPLVRCIVEVDGDGRPTLWFQPFEEPDLPLGLLVFGLEGATIGEASAIARAINTSGARLSTATH